MTPKEKALSIYNEMIVDFLIDGWQSKHCAISSVNQIISALADAGAIQAIKYWIDVRKEIEYL